LFTLGAIFFSAVAVAQPPWRLGYCSSNRANFRLNDSIQVGFCDIIACSYSGDYSIWAGAILISRRRNDFLKHGASERGTAKLRTRA